MAINFPSSPTNGQQFTNPTTGLVYTYSTASSSWIVSSGNFIGYTGSAALVVNSSSQFFVANGTQNTFNLSSPINNGNNAIVTVNGLVLSPSYDYYVNGSYLYLLYIPAANSEVEVRNFEGGTGSGSAGGAVGGGDNRAFFENDGTITTNYTITTGRNAMSAGPITINSNVVVTVPNNSVWVIV